MNIVISDGMGSSVGPYVPLSVKKGIESCLFTRRKEEVQRSCGLTVSAVEWNGLDVEAWEHCLDRRLHQFITVNNMPQFSCGLGLVRHAQGQRHLCECLHVHRLRWTVGYLRNHCGCSFSLALSLPKRFTSHESLDDPVLDECIGI